MGIDISTYRARIGLHRIKLTTTNTTAKCDFSNIASYFIGIITATLLLIAGIEANPGPTEMEQVLEAVKEIKQEISSIRHDQNSNYKMLENKISQIAVEFIQINKTQAQVIKTQEKHENFIRNYEIRERLNNLVFYGIPERRGERSWDMTYEICNFLAHQLAININEDAINNLYRLGKGNNRPY